MAVAIFGVFMYRDLLEVLLSKQFLIGDTP